MRGHAGFTLVEAMMSMLIVSILLVAAMRATGGSGLVQYRSAERTTARLLADGLMNNILALKYEEPTSSPAFGPEGGESTISKVGWDDVDDFNGWTESPPQDADGNVMTDLAGWDRTVLVERLTATTNPWQTVGTETGVKRITVTVHHNGRVAATRVAIRTKSPE
jgi:prepilin-type N-terminal cleavage/methylation domain-containing protein